MSIQTYVNSEEQQQKLYKRTLWIVVMSQIFGGAGLAAGVTVGGLLAKDMLGSDSFAGLPSALFTLGSAGAALTVGRISQRYGRRLGLSGGFIVGGLGAFTVVLAALLNNVYLLFAALLVYGAGTATNLQARYAGTDLANAKQRGKAISIAMVSTTLGAFAGPNLVGVMGDFANSIGVPALSGPFILAGVAYLLAGSVLFLFLKPDPLLVAQEIAKHQEINKYSVTAETLLRNENGVFLGASVMVITQIVMVAIMTMTPVHMGHYNYPLSSIGLVISLHITAMYLPSLVTGVLVDKIGRTKMVVLAALTLMLSGLIAAYAPGDSLPMIILALMLLGLGWNFGLISGTTLIVDSTPPLKRAKTQGTIDVLVALSGATGGAMSGVIVGSTSYAFLGIAGGVLSLILLPIVMWSMRKQTA